MELVLCTAELPRVQNCTHRALTVMAISNSVPELSSLAELLHDIHVLFVLKDIHKPDDVEAARELAQDLQLPFDAVDMSCFLLVREVANQMLANGLACEDVASISVGALAHDTVATFTNLLAQIILGADVAWVPKINPVQLMLTVLLGRG